MQARHVCRLGHVPSRCRLDMLSWPGSGSCPVATIAADADWKAVVVEDELAGVPPEKDNRIPLEGPNSAWPDLTGAEPVGPHPEVTGSDPALIMYTSAEPAREIVSMPCCRWVVVPSRKTSRTWSRSSHPRTPGTSRAKCSTSTAA